MRHISSMALRNWFLLLLLITVPSMGDELSGGEFAIRGALISNGGGELARTPLEASTTFGQARLPAISGGEFSLVGGFSPTPAANSVLFADGFEVQAE